MTIQNIDKAIECLLLKTNIKNNSVSRNGGVYFSGGGFVREIAVWKSDAYTTAMIAKCFQKWMRMKKV